MRPIVHTFSSFLVERAFEQIKLGFGHQGVGGVLVGSGGSFDIAGGGRTHQAPGDVALLDTIPGIHIHAPSTTQEVDATLRAVIDDDGLHYVRIVDQTNTTTYPASCHTPGTAGPPSVPGGLHVVRRGTGATVVAFGPTLDDVLAAAEGRDVTVLYAPTVRPFDAAGLPSRTGRTRGRAGRGLARGHLDPRRRRRPHRPSPPHPRPRRAATRAAGLRHSRRAPVRPPPRRLGIRRSLDASSPRRRQTRPAVHGETSLPPVAAPPLLNRSTNLETPPWAVVLSVATVSSTDIEPLAGSGVTMLDGWLRVTASAEGGRRLCAAG